MRRMARLGLLLVACFALGESTALAQAIAGVVRDASGGVMPGVTVEAADGFVYETRNRMTLCRCGESANKPFCDGSHAKVKFRSDR